MKRDRQAGLTLVELMVAGVVLGLVCGIVFKVLVTGSTLFASQARISETQSQAHFGMLMLSADAQNAGWQATPNCEIDPFVADKLTSCAPFEHGAGGGVYDVQSLRFDDAATGSYGVSAGNNPQFQPDELWILTSPFPGQTAMVTSSDGGALHFTAAAAGDPAKLNTILSWGLLSFSSQSGMSFRLGPPAASLSTGTGIGTEWVLTVDPVPTGMTGFGGNEMLVAALAWARYRLRPDPDDASGHKVDLVRELYTQTNLPPVETLIVAEYVVDFQATFCLDTSFVLGSTPIAPTLACGVSDEATINAHPEQLRTATLTLRTRDVADEHSAYADPDYPLQWYDLDGNPNTGVARVRTATRTVSLLNQRIRP